MEKRAAKPSGRRASLLGNDVAEEVTAEHAQIFAAMVAAPAAAKAAVSRAYRRQRSTREFDKR
jgi:hypothetical protein